VEQLKGHSLLCTMVGVAPWDVPEVDMFLLTGCD